MAVRVMLDHPQRFAGRRLRQWVTALLGGVLVFVGVVAAAAALPAVFLALGAAVDPEFTPALRAVGLLAPVASVIITMVALRVGLRLVRGDRALVLFLRRFGYAAATKVVTFASEKTIGRSWRVVTLDDAAVAPLGVPIGTSRLVRAGGSFMPLFIRSGDHLRKLFLLFWSPLAIPGVDYLRTRFGSGPERSSEYWDRYFDIFDAFGRGDLPISDMGASFHGVFAVAACIWPAVTFVVAVMFVLLLLAVAFSGALALAEHAAEAAGKADLARYGEVESSEEIGTVAMALTAGARKIFSPRLVVLRVATIVWQETVARLAAVASVNLIDVSEPTENLLWEIEALTKGCEAPCVFVGHHDRVSPMASADEALPASPLNERLSVLLQGREVLAYRVDRRGMRRFARALRSKLLEASG